MQAAWWKNHTTLLLEHGKIGEGMRINRHIGYLMLFLGSCVYPFHPKIDEIQDMMVINGKITDRPGEHVIEVSRASPYNDPGFFPVSGCVVRVEDEGGEGVSYEEYEPGVYRAYLDGSFLGLNKAYKLFVFTADGREYQSDYDTLFACPPLDSVYYQIESEPTEDPEITYGGIQFYVDAKGDSRQAANYMWELEETFEYHAKYPVQYFYSSGTLTEYDPPRDSLTLCYLTQEVPELYTATTGYLSTNELKQFPLNFVSGSLPKLKYRYSLLVSQHSLSENAFQYWDKMRNLQQESGGMYETQPSTARGNLFNIYDDGELVLGYFYASQVHKKRINLKNTFDFKIHDFACGIVMIELLSDLEDLDLYILKVITEDGTEQWAEPDQACVDCRQRGGSLNPPSFWTEYD